MSASVTGSPVTVPAAGTPSISVCAITHAGRLDAFPAFLLRIYPVLLAYEGDVELVIGNNGGVATRPALEAAVRSTRRDADVPRHLQIRLVDSPRNDIATGRNLVIDAAVHEFIAFIDDDERPILEWLPELVAAQRSTTAKVVAGPVVPVFPDDAPHWVRHMDLHNAVGRKDLDDMPFAPAGNFLMSRPLAAEVRFDESFGRRGGSDTDFFLRAKARGARIVWASRAIVEETVSAQQAGVRATLRRCLLQGSNYRRIMEANGLIGSSVAFSARAALLVAISLPIGVTLACVRHPSAGNWIKRGMSNLGKLWRQDRLLYG